MNPETLETGTAGASPGVAPLLEGQSPAGTTASARAERAFVFLTCGHVDDGKSTLIGRLLHDLGAVPEDQIQGAMVDGVLDYSRLTDGLEDERTQGITIDVASRFFRWRGRHYRIADTPGHLQYVRNMAVAAVGADCALLVIDAAHGLREQTLRHARIALFFGIRRFIVAVNKMDLVGWSESRFREIEDSCRRIPDPAAAMELSLIPVSALFGDNVAAGSERMAWYPGPSLIECLAGLDLSCPPESGARLPIQSVIRVGDRRGVQGMLSGGEIRLGDRLGIGGSGLAVTVRALYHGGRESARVHPGQSITLVPEEDVDLGRGNVLFSLASPVHFTDGFDADLIWLDPRLADATAVPALIKIHHREVQAEIEIRRAGDPVSEALVFTAAAVPLDGHASHHATGLFLVIDPVTDGVIGVGRVSGVGKREFSYSI